MARSDDRTTEQIQHAVFYGDDYSDETAAGMRELARRQRRSRGRRLRSAMLTLRKVRWRVLR